MKSSKIRILSPHIIDSLLRISTDAYLLSFTRKFGFIPGQVVALSTVDNDPAPRIYSICSGRDEGVLSILFNVIPGGKLTNQLVNLKKGDTIFCSDPYGSFFGDMSPAYWIASGTGIAPYISMSRSGMADNKIVVHGGRSIDSFYFQDELKRIFQSRYVRCSSTEKGEGVFEGRLTRYLEQSDNLDPAYRYYLCGSAEMVVEARDILIKRGIPYHMILSEIYF